MKSKLNSFLTPLIFFVLVGVGLEALIQAQVIPEFLLPRPSSVLSIYFQMDSGIWEASLQTSKNSLQGFLIAVLVSFFVAALALKFKLLSKLLLPISVFFQTVPIIAIAPLLVIWFGFGDPTVRASAAVVCFFPVLAQLLKGFSHTDPQFIELFKVYKKSELQTLISLRIPYAIPDFFLGLKVSSGLAVVGAIVGEFVGGGGLGSLIDVGRTSQRLDLVFAAVLASTMIGLLAQMLIWIVQSFFKKYYFHRSG